MLVPVATGVFPLVLFSHGFSGFRYQSSTLTSHMATWGFVVCAPDHPGRDLASQLDATIGATPPTTDPNADVQDLIALRNYLSANKVPALKGHVDVKHVIAWGHSAGGSASERLASWGTTQPVNWVKGFIGMAGMSNLSWSSTVAPYNAMPTEPGLVIAGDNDNVVPAAGLQTAFAALTGTKYFAEMANAGQQSMSSPWVQHATSLESTAPPWPSRICTPVSQPRCSSSHALRARLAIAPTQPQGSNGS